MKNPYPKINAANEELRQYLDKLYACMDDCLFAIGQKSGFHDMCSALMAESDALIQYLSDLEEKYQEELPLEKEEPKDVDWYKEREKLQEYREEFQKHEHFMGSEFPKVLCGKLQEIRESLNRIDNGLYPEDDSDIYSSYSKRELDVYNMGAWNKDSKEIRNLLAKPTNAHRPEYCQEQLDILLGKLRGISEYIINEDSTIIFHEGLGRLLWQVRHDSESTIQMNEILFVVKGIEYYCGRLHQKLTFLDFETSPNEEVDERVRLENLRQETLQNQHEKMAYRLCRCENYLTKDFSTQWLHEMITEMINSEHSEKVCDKMKNRKLVKFIHQIAGVLLKCEVFDTQCTYNNIVEAISFNKPAKKSRADYIRHMIEDVPEIQEWLVAYIAAYREELKRKKEAEQQGVNVNC